jgi:hypothetical protein
MAVFQANGPRDLEERRDEEDDPGQEEYLLASGFKLPT